MPVELWLECLASADVVRPGQDQLLVVGNCPSLGLWEPYHGVELQPAPRPPSVAKLEDPSAGVPDLTWSLPGGPLTLSEDPDFLPWKLEYRYVVRRGGSLPGEYCWEDVGECEVPTFSGCGSSELALPWKWALKKVNRRLRLPCCHAVLLRRDRCTLVYNHHCGAALCEHAWHVGPNWGPARAGRSSRLGPRCRETCALVARAEDSEELDLDEDSQAKAELAARIFLGRRYRLLAALEQLARRQQLPGHVWGDIGAFVGPHEPPQEKRVKQ